MRRVVVLCVLVTVGLAAPVWAADSPTIVRVFNLHYTSAIDASNAVQPLLSEDGALTVQPHKSRITVQDTPEVMARVTEVLAELDKSPKKYRIRVRLLEGTDSEVSARRSAEVDSRVKRMFPFASYQLIGSKVFAGELGSMASAAVGEGYRISFLPNLVRIPKESAFGIPHVGDRVQLEVLTLERLTESQTGEQRAVEIIRTNVYLSPKQEVIIGAGGSEDSRSGLVLILKAESVGGT
jgi:hypothetical protein